MPAAADISPLIFMLAIVRCRFTLRRYDVYGAIFFSHLAILPMLRAYVIDYAARQLQQHARRDIISCEAR